MKIEVNNISKSYGEVQALKNIQFSVEEGELFGLIGPDGAGKTTLFRILTTLLLPNEGEAKMAGLDTVKDYKKIRNLLGYMPGRFSLYQDLSVEENLEFFASVFDTSIEENYDLIKDIYVQIEPFKKRLAGKLSGGMKQKLALSCALIHKPEILVLDEPTTGVDAVSRKEFWQMLKRLQKHNITIIVSTPYMDEAAMCDRVALIQDGEIMQIDSPQQIEADFPHDLWAIQAKDMYSLLKELRAMEETYSVYPFGEFVHFIPKQGEIDKDRMKLILGNKALKNVIVQDVKANIEDCFMDLMRKN